MKHDLFAINIGLKPRPIYFDSFKYFKYYDVMEASPIINFSYKHSINNVMKPHQHIFDFYSDTNKIATLVCHKSDIPIRPNYEAPVLAIDFLEVTNKHQGFGTKILKFAQEYSEDIGCKGYMTLKADSSFTPQKIPHIFYRKFGFSTLDKNMDKKLDKFVKQQKAATIKDFPCLLMHYPPLPDTIISILRKIFNFIFHI